MPDRRVSPQDVLDAFYTLDDALGELSAALVTARRTLERREEVDGEALAAVRRAETALARATRALPATRCDGCGAARDDLEGHPDTPRVLCPDCTINALERADEHRHT
jgi:hypothetical protein